MKENLPKGTLPSISTIVRDIHNDIKLVIEGEFRFQELKNYLQENSLQSVVWISEDTTRVTGRIQYDAQNNQISGFTPPLNNNGVPVVGFFPAETSEKI